MRMLRKAALALMLFLPLAAGPARAQDDAVRSIYESMAPNVQQEYEALLGALARGATGGPGANAPKTREMLKVLYYNKAALFAFCAAEAERVRSPRAERVPAQNNLMLTTCVEEKFGELNKFSNTLGYALIFFPERIESCGEQVRLHDQEKLLPPYPFLHLDEPKLYDFARYNKCLMTKE
jgi:hypothetical protein